MSYENACKFFSQDPSQKCDKFILMSDFDFLVILCFTNIFCHFRWAAYVAGTVLVLMTELGVRFGQSISILVSVWKGKSSMCSLIENIK